MSELITVGVVTVLYNSAAELPDFVVSLSTQRDVRIRLYAVDNASTDDSVSILREAMIPNGQVEVIVCAENLGVAEGNNIGIRAALRDGVDWILLLNNDTEFPPTMIRSLVDVAEKHDRPVVSPVIEGDNPRGTVWYGGGHWRSWRGHQIEHEHWKEDLASRLAEVGDADDTVYAPTCCLLVRPDVFERVGLMDASYFVYYDDVDFAIRCVSAGFTYTITSKVTLYHKAGGATGGPRSPFAIRWETRNWVVVARRYSKNWLQRSISLLYIPIWSLWKSRSLHEPWKLYGLRLRAYAEGVKADLSDHGVPTGL